jgi:hypothetical protein
LAQYELGPLGVSGGVSFSAETYTIDGISRRRAPTSAMAQTNLGFDLYGLTSGLTLSYSTDQSELRQSINRFAFDTSWKWGELSVGDVNPRFSEYSLQGTVLRGGQIELQWKEARLAMAAGRTQQALAPDSAAGFRDPSYRQFGYGAQLGYGDERGTHAMLSGVYVRDVVSSLPDNLALPASALGSQEPLSPQENLSLTPAVGLSLLDDRLTFQGQITASAVTRDLRAPLQDAGTLPVYFESVFSERRSTRLDYAGDAELRLRWAPADLEVTYKRIQPGFESLGVPQLRNDEERMAARPSVSLLDQRLRLGGNVVYSHNNLNDQLLATHQRLQLGLNTQARVTDRLSTSGSYTRMTTLNDPAADAPNPVERQQELVMQTVTLSPTYSIQNQNALSHLVSASGTYQRTADQSDAVAQNLRPAFDTNSLTGTLTYGLTFPTSLNVTASGNALRSSASNTTTTVYGANVGGGYALFDGGLRLDGSVGWSHNESVTERTTNVSTQAALQALAPSLEPKLKAAAANDDRLQYTGWYERVARTPRAERDYAWYLSSLLHGTSSEVYYSDLEWALAQQFYDGPMLQQLTQTFESLSTQWTASLGASYRIGTGDTVRLSVRGLRSASNTGADFTEVQATLNYQHRF